MQDLFGVLLLKLTFLVQFFHRDRCYPDRFGPPKNGWRFGREMEKWEPLRHRRNQQVKVKMFGSVWLPQHHGW